MGAPTTQVTLIGLNEYTNYSITVFASTVKGDGSVSEPVIVITDEDSTFSYALFDYHNKIEGYFNNMNLWE